MSPHLSGNSFSFPHIWSPMVFTERLVVLALAFTFLIANGHIGAHSYPLQQTFLKHMVGMLLIGACLLDYIGYKITKYIDGEGWEGAGQYWFWLCLLSIYVMSGSLYARFELNIRETFFINGFYMLVGFVFSLNLRRENLDRLVHAMFWLTLLFSLYICVQTLYVRANDIHVQDTFIHEREFLVIPLLYIVVFGPMLRGWGRIITILLIVATTAAALKSTPILVFGITLSMIIWRWLAHAKGENRHLPGIGMALALLFMLMMGAVFLIAFYSGSLETITPRSNIDFREHQYKIAWNEFLNSPLIGSAFTAETGIYFSHLASSMLGGGVSLPTHNDILDILRGGGMLGIFLWLIPLGLLITRAVGVLRAAVSKQAWGCEHDIVAWLLLTNLAAIIVYSVNPILSKTAFASLVWIFFGFLAAGVTKIRRGQADER